MDAIPDCQKRTRSIRSPQRTAHRRILRGGGYKVLKAKEGPEVPQIAERHTQPIHLMLTDLIIPQMSGREPSEKIAGRPSGDQSSVHVRILEQPGLKRAGSRCRAYSPAEPFRLTILGQRV